MSENSIIVYDPQLAVDQARNARVIVAEMRRKVLVESVDYGIIPGTTKPTLLKPGAEKLCTAFGLCPEFEPISQIEDFENGVFHYRYRCSLIHIASGKKIATGIGSCNSKEDKYRWRNEECPNCHKQKIFKSKYADRQTGEFGWYCGGCKSNFPASQFTGAREENADPFSIVNTLDKMSQKRALVAAVLIGTGASEFFTQDIEDLPQFGDVIEGDFVESPSPEQIHDAGVKLAEPSGNGSRLADPRPASVTEKRAQPKHATSADDSPPLSRDALSPDALIKMLKRKATSIKIDQPKDENGKVMFISNDDAQKLAQDMETIMDTPTRKYILAQAFGTTTCTRLWPVGAGAIQAWLDGDKVVARREAEMVRTLVGKLNANKPEPPDDTEPNVIQLAPDAGDEQPELKKAAGQ